VFDGREYLMEKAIVGDFAIVKGWKADRYGNVGLPPYSTKF